MGRILPAETEDWTQEDFDDLERELDIAYARRHYLKYAVLESFEREPGEKMFNVFLKVGVQKFCVTPEAFDVQEEAELIQELLARAVCRLVLDEAIGEIGRQIRGKRARD